MQRRTGRARAQRAMPAPEQNASPAMTLPVVLVSEAVVLPQISAPLILDDERAEAAVARAFERDVGSECHGYVCLRCGRSDREAAGGDEGGIKAVFRKGIRVNGTQIN